MVDICYIHKPVLQELHDNYNADRDYHANNIAYSCEIDLNDCYVLDDYEGYEVPGERCDVAHGELRVQPIHEPPLVVQQLPEVQEVVGNRHDPRHMDLHGKHNVVLYYRRPFMNISIWNFGNFFSVKH